MRKLSLVLFPQFIGSLNTAFLGPVIFSKFSFTFSFIIVLIISTFISYLLIKIYDKNKKDVFGWESAKKKNDYGNEFSFFFLILYNPTIAVIRYRPSLYKYNGIPDFNTRAIFSFSCISSGIIGACSSDLIFLFFKNIM